jgi:cbb3-type cytochrome oxidase cytochrome c subunit
LTEEGAKRRSPEWLERHFLQPNDVSPNSPMPKMGFTRSQARSLSFYMLSLTNEQMGSYYSSVRLIPSPAQGRTLFVEKNCMACHNIGGVGATSGPDLLGVTGRHSTGWLDEQLVNPQLVSTGSAMPAYDLEANARKAIIGFMAAATPEDAKLILAGRAKALTPEESIIEAGRNTFVRFGCLGCHGIEAKGGVPNPNSQSGEIPSLLHVADDYTKAEVAKIIEKGKMAPVADVKKPNPPLYMPAWRNVLTDEDIHRIIEYIWSLRPQQKEAAW